MTGEIIVLTMTGEDHLMTAASLFVDRVLISRREPSLPVRRFRQFTALCHPIPNQRHIPAAPCRAHARARWKCFIAISRVQTSCLL